MFIVGDEVKWMLIGEEEDSGWITRIFPTEERAWIIHPDGTFKEVGFGDLHLVARFPSSVRNLGALCVQSLGTDPNFVTKPDLDSLDLPKEQRNFIESMVRCMPMSRGLFQEHMGRLIDLSGVFDKISDLEQQIADLNRPDKNVNWLNQRRRDLEKTIEENEDKIALLSNERRQLEEKVAQLESMNAKFVGSYKQFLEQKELLVNTSQKLDEHKKMLEQQLSEEKMLVSKLTETGGNQESAIAQLQTEKSDLRRELVDTKGLFKDEITRRENCEMKIATLEKQNADLLAQLELLVSANRELQQGMREWRIQNQDIFAQLKNLSSRKIPTLTGGSTPPTNGAGGAPMGLSAS